MPEATPREQIEELLLLQRVAQRINSTLDLDILLEQIVTDVAQTFGYWRSAILLKDETTNDLVLTHGWTGDLKRIGDRFRIGRSGIAGHVGGTRHTHYAPDVRVDPYYETGHPSTRSELDIPLKVRGRFIGVFDIQHTEVDAFSPNRIRLLEALAGHVATAIDNAHMFQRERFEKERLLMELDGAQRIQRSLLPSGARQVSGFTMTGVCLPCRAVGGDWYDYVPLDDGRTAVVLADVAGKGLAAALLMSSTRSLLRLVAREGARPAEVLSRMNRILLDDFPTARFVTMVYALLDPDEGLVDFANAGHLPPLLVETTAAHFQETVSGLPLGIGECEFSERSIRMAPGSRLVLYSDGIAEASGVSADEFGLARIQDHFSQPGASVNSLLEEVRRFCTGTPLFDDATVVSVEALTEQNEQPA
jgi:sigma-B regulation protein RsbU (phosphoserine phosphatase)